jgi:hypothetical protein
MKTEAQRVAYNAYMREYRKRPGPRIKEATHKAAVYAKWAANATPEQWEAKRLKDERAVRKVRWGSTEEYAARLAKQNGLCALCRKPFDDTEMGRPVQDHDHKTEELREFLHRRCNLGIGNFLDDATLCRQAAEYLVKHTSS